jgi:DNA-binding FadR family transcriptional regulator
MEGGGGTVPSIEEGVFLSEFSNRSEKASELLVRQFIREIAEGRLLPGTALMPEAAMLRRFGVSRSTLREALRVLSAYGVIAMRPGPLTPVVEQVSSTQFARSSTLYFHLVGATLRHLLEARQLVEPPAIIEQADSTTVCPSGFLLNVDQYLNMILRRQ